MPSHVKKFCLLSWKNWKIKLNQKVKLLIDLTVPLVFTFALVYIRILIPTTKYDSLIFNKTFPLDNLDFHRQVMNLHPTEELRNLPIVLVFSPMACKLCAAIMTEATKSLGVPFIPVENSMRLVETVMLGDLFAGIDFGEEMTNLKEFPKKLHFAIRFPSELRTEFDMIFHWQTDRKYSRADSYGPRNELFPCGGNPVGYIREGYLAIQHSLSTAFIKLAGKAKAADIPKVLVQRFPHPQFTADKLVLALPMILETIIMLAYLYPVIYTVKHIAMEKEMQLKDVMTVMGLQSWIHWVAWFFHTSILMIVSTLMIIVLLKIHWIKDGSILMNSSFSALLFYFIMFILPSVTACFMLTAFFRKSSNAAAVSAVYWFVTSVPNTYFVLRFGAVENSVKLFWGILSNTALGLGFHIITALEAEGEGLQWHNMFTSDAESNELPMYSILILFCISSCIHMVICLYMEQISPGDFGMGKRWNFFLDKNFWFPSREKSFMHPVDMESQDPLRFEGEKHNKIVGIRARNLTKNFGSKWAVNNVSFNMYQDEITVLLGHNGAGKTTTISMLMGTIKPTSGNVFINGYDLQINLAKARESLSICPQHNVLFDELSVKDHLIFFGTLRGLKGSELREEVEKYLKLINMQNKARTKSKKLSGGMKRKLSLCCALCGNPKIVLCDEPSSGLDPGARRYLWNLLQSEKSGRTILLTTHYMDEADVLGDRIAILSSGVLMCMGTSMFLKKRFGVGYRLTCIKREGCNSSETTKLINKYIPSVKIDNETLYEITYLLPDEYGNKFSEMFGKLEKNSNQLGIEGFGVTMTTLEDVFLKFAEGADDKEPQTANEDAYEYFSETPSRVEDKSIFFSHKQWSAMFLKKYLITARNKVLFLLPHIAVILFVWISVFLTPAEIFPDLPELIPTIDHFTKSVTIIDTTLKPEPKSVASKIIESLKQIVSSFGPDHRVEETGTKSVIDHVLSMPKQHMIYRKYVGGATIGDRQIIMWLNNKPLHTATICLTLINNAIAKVFISPDAEIIPAHYPLPYKPLTKAILSDGGMGVGTQLSIQLGFCLCVIAALYVMFPITERETRAKLLQFVCGIRGITYWVTHFLWDLITFSLIIAVAVVTLFSFQEDGYSSVEEIGRFAMFLMAFVVAILPFTYYLSWYSDESATGFSKVIVLYALIGVIPFLITVALQSPLIGLFKEAYSAQKSLMVSPTFSLSTGIYWLYINTKLHKACKPFLKIPKPIRCPRIPMCCKIINYSGWSRPGIGRPYASFIICFFWSWALICMKQYDVLRYIKSFFTRKKRIRYHPMDHDVRAERNKIQRMSMHELKTFNLVVNRLSKYYRKFLAVKQISFAVKNMECFGLLGLNGAGKTTTFKILTGDQIMTSGTVYVKGKDIRYHKNSVLREIGYCPQFDALFPEFTGRETLRIYGLIYGLSIREIPSIIYSLASAFGFLKHIDKKVRKYSGGNKRKLSSALSVIGSPSVVLLDEPTCGIDPGSRRGLWNALMLIRQSGRSVVLCSHSMEECEALCTRIAVMVRGEFMCIGPIQKLRIQFSKGLIVKIKLLKPTLRDDEVAEDSSNDFMEDENAIIEFMTTKFPTAVLSERYHHLLAFTIPIAPLLWSNIFGVLEAKKSEYGIEYYSVSQTTLEDVFLQFS